MSKIPTMDVSGNQKLINVAGSNPAGGKTPMAPPVMTGWNAHDAVAAAGTNAGTPKESVGAPVNTIPGEPLPFPARSAPETIQVAGRDSAPKREGN
jgi:hypothetical protein